MQNTNNITDTDVNALKQQIIRAALHLNDTETVTRLLTQSNQMIPFSDSQVN
jgi:hypothetical protein